MSTGGLTPALARAWERWQQFNDPVAREQLIVHYSPLVKFVAGRICAGLPSSVDARDLVSAGIFGLIDAIERFDPSRGAKFETFAIPRIRGAILDGLRSIDWVPRSVRSRARMIESAIAKLEAKLRRAPTDEELAEELRVGPEELQRWLAAVAMATVGPLDHLVGSSVPEPRWLHSDDLESPAAVFEQHELRELMRAELRRLPERERTVIALYYGEGLTLSEIGEVLGVTESRVSQIHTKAVLMLRTRLASAGI